MRYAIAYDISDDRRRLRVAKFLECWGRRVQKSVFECDCSTEDLIKVYGRLKELLDKEEDRCHIYQLCGACAPKSLVIGSSLEPEWVRAVIV